MNAAAPIALDHDRLEAAPAGVWSRHLDTATPVGRKVRADAVRANTAMDGFAELPLGGFKRPGLGRALGRNAAADYSKKKTFYVHNGPRAHWRLAPGLSA